VRLERLPRVLLHLEGAAVAVAALSLYLHESYSLLLLAVLVLAPDLSALGFLAGPRVGAVTYDALHTFVGPVLLGAVGVILPSDTATAVALIWLLHIGADRALGYGLKYPSAFKDTHLRRV
jgi:hypothetical protein